MNDKLSTVTLAHAPRVNDRASTVTLAHAPRVNEGVYILLSQKLSQENPNFSFLLPFAQYNLQCPGYYLPVLKGKWVYPHSSSTCRIWNKIISYSAITRDPHRGGWVVGRAEGCQVAFFWRSGKRRCIFFHRSCW